MALAMKFSGGLTGNSYPSFGAGQQSTFLGGGQHRGGGAWRAASAGDSAKGDLSLSMGGSMLRSSSRGDLSTSFVGSGICDLRSVVVAQQRQLDGLIDKVSALIAAMHQEISQDLKHATDKDQSGIATRLAELRRVEGTVDSRMEELRHSEGELRVWLDGEMSSVYDKVASVEGWRQEVSQELRQNVDSLRQEVSSDLRQELRPLSERLASIEDRVLSHAQHSQHSQQAMLPALPEFEASHESRYCQDAAESAERAAHEAGNASHALEIAEETVRRHDIALEDVSADVNELRRSCVRSDALEAQLFDLRRWGEERWGSNGERLEDAELRLERIEHWHKRFEEQHAVKAARIVEPLQDRVVTIEQRIITINDRVQSSMGQMQQISHAPITGGLMPRADPWANSDTQRRIEAVSERVESLASSMHQEIRLFGQRLNDVKSSDMRIDGVESIAESCRMQLKELKIASRTQDAGYLQGTAADDTQRQLRQDINNLRSGLDSATHHTEDLARQLRQEMGGLRSGIEGATTTIDELQRQCRKDASSHSQHIDECRARAEETQRQVVQLQAVHEDLVSNNEAVALDAAAALSPLMERLEKGEAAIEQREKAVQKAAAAVVHLETKLRDISEDLQARIAHEGDVLKEQIAELSDAGNSFMADASPFDFSASLVSAAAAEEPPEPPLAVDRGHGVRTFEAAIGQFENLLRHSKAQNCSSQSVGQTASLSVQSMKGQSGVGLANKPTTSGVHVSSAVASAEDVLC